MAEGGWISRKRKRPAERVPASKGAAVAGPSSSATKTPASLSANNANDAPPSSAAAAGNYCIPVSLAPHLAWTKMSARHARPRKRRNDDWDKGEGVQRVAGRAVFFIHDPRPGGGTSGRDESKIWFQGRFFPSAATGVARRRNNSPTSVSSEMVVAAPSSTLANRKPWGLLAVQNEILDECLCCSEGGYRQLDLTFIRHQKTGAFSRKEKKVRWVARDVLWTGGNMMALSTDPYNLPGSSLSGEEPAMKFEPRKLMDGERAMGVAAKCFPAMAKRLRIHNVTNEEGDESMDSEAMVIFGDMEVVAPTSFVKTRGAVFSPGGEDTDDDLWKDE